MQTAEDFYYPVSSSQDLCFCGVTRTVLSGGGREGGREGWILALPQTRCSGKARPETADGWRGGLNFKGEPKRRSVGAQKLCERRGVRPWLPVPNSPYGLFGHKETLNLNMFVLRVQELCES